MFVIGRIHRAIVAATGCGDDRPVYIHYVRDPEFIKVLRYLDSCIERVPS